ncbi:pseudouridine synthase [Xylaria bambusicola]|uniref:pseudouridine synthase n=1 Tax=Xylaria bambusicola TaxID=326684 RepID=UPI00200761A3|nr:pseudouridine synthase [Xylaria bambusicola]KAI0506768.1 pseudouridine synthase [Xylaria bambusicola]
MATHTAMAQGSDAVMRNSLEQRLGIIHFVSTKEHGWSGHLRTRYTDFQVNEITKGGEVVHLSDFHSNSRELARAASQNAATPTSTQQSQQPDAPKRAQKGNGTVKGEQRIAEEKTGTPTDEIPKDGIPESDKATLVDLIGQATADELIGFYEKILQSSKTTSKGPGDVNIPSIRDKSQRSRVHGEIRRIFGGKIETTTGPDDSIKATAVRGGNRQRGNRSANNTRNGRQNLTQENAGPYLHFSLYKENKDTMDALNHMAKTLRLHPKAFGAAGTKDRRAVTVQRVSIKNRSPNSLIAVNERINNVKIGDFKYEQDPIRLNDHDGNEFVIVLKNCVFSGTEALSFEQKLKVANSTIDSALTQLIQRGFINYYGTQRFGTHQIGTQEVGMKILKGDFSGAVQALLSYDPLLLGSPQDQESGKGGYHKEDISRARACSAFLETKDAGAALDHLPPRCHVEKTIIQHLGKSPTDYVSALMSINRSMRTMYGHAYQSLVWNFVASKRWERYGSEVINGDLVLVKSKSATIRTDDEDRDREDSVVWGDDITTSRNSGLVPHAITEDDLQDRKYSIYDVVLPSPGWDVTYPPNEIGDYYFEFMGKPENGGLDPYDMRRPQRDFSLPGSYRKLMGKLKRVPTASVQAYSNDLEQLVPTDLDIILSRKADEAKERESRQQGAATEWHAFTQNVHQNELEESKARVTHRQTEDPMPSARINDTWVQTSVDGSNKRIKIARHADICNDDDPMQVDDDTAGDNPAKFEANTTVVDRQDAVDGGVQDQQPASKGLASSIIAAVTAQPTTDGGQPQPAEIPPEPRSTDGAVTASGPIVQTIPTPSSSGPEIDTGSSQAIAAPLPSSTIEDLQPELISEDSTSTAAVEKVEATNTGTVVPADPINPNKIAVILRFALDTSQYATIVIRELQGAVVTSKGFAQKL